MARQMLFAFEDKPKVHSDAEMARRIRMAVHGESAGKAFMMATARVCQLLRSLGYTETADLLHETSWREDEDARCCS